MRFLSHVPGMPLRQFAENFWWCSDAPGHAMERIVPSGTVELVFNLREDDVRIYDQPCAEERRRYGGAVISGTYGRPFLIDSAQHGSMLGVHFRPAGRVGCCGRLCADSRTRMWTSRQCGVVRR